MLGWNISSLFDELLTCFYLLNKVLLVLITEPSVLTLGKYKLQYHIHTITESFNYGYWGKDFCNLSIPIMHDACVICA